MISQLYCAYFLKLRIPLLFSLAATLLAPPLSCSLIPLKPSSEQTQAFQIEQEAQEIISSYKRPFAPQKLLEGQKQTYFMHFQETKDSALLEGYLTVELLASQEEQHLAAVRFDRVDLVYKAQHPRQERLQLRDLQTLRIPIFKNPFLISHEKQLIEDLEQEHLEDARCYFEEKVCSQLGSVKSLSSPVHEPFKLNISRYVSRVIRDFISYATIPWRTHHHIYNLIELKEHRWVYHGRAGNGEGLRIKYTEIKGQPLNFLLQIKEKDHKILLLEKVFT